MLQPSWYQKAGMVKPAGTIQVEGGAEGGRVRSASGRASGGADQQYYSPHQTATVQEEAADDEGTQLGEGTQP